MEEFFKSTHSSAGNCVEVAFRKSTHSHNGACVEVGFAKSSHCTVSNCVEVGFSSAADCSMGNCAQVHIALDAVYVRDSKHEDGPVLTFSYEEWAAFVKGMKDGQFDLPVTVPEQGEGVEA